MHALYGDAEHEATGRPHLSPSAARNLLLAGPWQVHGRSVTVPRSMISTIRVLFIAPSALAPSTRYRATELLPGLAQAGIFGAVRYHTGSAFHRFRMPGLWRLGGWDAVILRRQLLPRNDLLQLRKRVRRLIFDFDDAVHLGRKGGKAQERRQKRFRRVVSCADLVLAGNPFLKDAALAAGAKRVEVLPTALPTARYSTVRLGDGCTLGWIGSRENLVYLQEILPVLEALAETHPPLKLRIICDAFLKSERLTIEEIPWSREGELRALAGVDIGLGPLRDEPWSRGKCGFKLLQYMAAGLPVVASPVGVQSDIVEEGRSGWLPKTPAEWTAAVADLLDHPARRLSMGTAGRARVVAHYDSGAMARRLSEYIMDL